MTWSDHGTGDGYVPDSHILTTSAGHHLNDIDLMTAAELVKREAAYRMWRYSQSHVVTMIEDSEVPSAVESLVKEITTLRLPLGREDLTKLLRFQHPHLEDIDGLLHYAQPECNNVTSESDRNLASKLLWTSIAINSTACGIKPDSSAKEWADSCYLPLLEASKELGTSVSIQPSFSIPSHLHIYSDSFKSKGILRGLLTDQVRVGAAIKSEASFNDLSLRDDHPAQSSLTPLCDAKGLGLFTATVDWQPPSNDSHGPLTEGPIEPELWHHSRMATGSICRHLHWLGIDSPVFGLMFAKGRMMLHIDWYEYSRFRRDHLQIMSMPVEPPDVSATQYFRVWDLREPHAALESALLLSYLFRYTATKFADLAGEALKKLDQNAFDREGWKLDTSKMPLVVEGARRGIEQTPPETQESRTPPETQESWSEGIVSWNTEVVPGTPSPSSPCCPCCGHLLDATNEEGLDMGD